MSEPTVRCFVLVEMIPVCLAMSNLPCGGEVNDGAYKIKLNFEYRPMTIIKYELTIFNKMFKIHLIQSMDNLKSFF